MRRASQFRRVCKRVDCPQLLETGILIVELARPNTAICPAASFDPTAAAALADHAATAEKLVAYFGLNPRVRQSGGQPASLSATPEE